MCTSSVGAQVKALLATADDAGLVLIFRISSSPEKLGKDADDGQEDYYRYDSGVPNIYRPVARCGPAFADRVPTRGDGIARLAWAGSVLYTASDAGVVQRWAIDL